MSIEFATFVAVVFTLCMVIAVWQRAWVSASVFGVVAACWFVFAWS